MLGHFWNLLALWLPLIKQKVQLLVNKAVRLLWKVQYSEPIFLLEENDLVMSEHETVLSVWYHRLKECCFSFSYYLQSSGFLNCRWEWSWPVRAICYPYQDKETSEKNLEILVLLILFETEKRERLQKQRKPFFKSVSQ